MEFDGGELDDFEAPGKHLAQGVVKSKRATILNDDVAKLCKGPSLCEPKHFETHSPISREAMVPMKVAKWGLANWL